MTSLSQGILVAIEGIDGAGKTTQANLLVAALKTHGFDAFYTKEPTTGTWGQKIRASKTAGRLAPDEEYEAFLEDRKEHVQDLLQPAVEQGQIAIIDRYYFSTMAYQGAIDYKPWQEIQADNEAFAPRPDLLVLLEMPVEGSLSRIDTREETEGPDAFEDDENLRRCAKIFAQIQGDYVLRLDANQDKDALHRLILGRVLEIAKAR